MKKYFLCLIIVFACLAFLGCKKGGQGTQDGSVELIDIFGMGEKSSGANINTLSFVRTPVLHFINRSVGGDLIKLPFGTNAHREHLNDPLVFRDIPDGGFPSGSTAVVGSDVCHFYPVTNMSVLADVDRLPRGEPIPFATIIPLGAKLEASDSERDKMFIFQDHTNFFYRTTWNGREGVVFGSDLYGINDTNESNRISSLLYSTNGVFDSFYPVNGYDYIDTAILTEMESMGLAFQEVKKDEYNLSINMPDDMISLYMMLGIKRSAPIFVTTDLAAHANHLVFSRMLQYIEENFFFPQLVSLTNAYIDALEERKEQIPQAVYDTTLLYFQTAHALLALAPERIKGNDYYGTVEYKDINAEQVLANYPPQVVQEIRKMNAASGMDDSSIFGSMAEDYSQYKVRGHYTKNGVLGAYFQALMWYGRINFVLGGDNAELRDLAEKLAPIALLITDITESSSEIKLIWQSLFDPITEIIGASDDISFYELAPLWNRIKGAGFSQWYSDANKRHAFISREYAELRPPAISGSSLFQGAHAGGNAPEDRRPPTGWRLFGQRYTLDSEIHHNISPPRFIIPGRRHDEQRHMVRGLDIMKVFGSNTADRFLRAVDYPKYPGLEDALNGMQRNLEQVNDDYWVSTYYTNILYQIKTMGQFERGAGFYFTEKPGWDLKAMNAAHGTWAELRHDTILYVKQTYAETAGNGGWITFRTKPIPEPVHYIEPNVPFWIISAIGMQKMYSILEKYNFLDGPTAQVLSAMHELFVKAAEISALQADNQEVSREDLNWIRRIGNLLARLVIIHTPGGHIDDADSLRMALVADVFTNAEIQMVLETAVGIPYRIYVPLNDKQGGKRIAIAYGFSYYEFNQPMSARLNNEEWKAIVYDNNPNMTQYLPFWMQGRVQRPKGYSEWDSLDFGAQYRVERGYF